MMNSPPGMLFIPSSDPCVTRCNVSSVASATATAPSIARSGAQHDFLDESNAAPLRVRPDISRSSASHENTPSLRATPLEPEPCSRGGTACPQAVDVRQTGSKRLRDKPLHLS